MNLAALGDALRGAGLTPRLLAAWAGTERLAALPRVVDARGRLASAHRRGPVDSPQPATTAEPHRWRWVATADREPTTIAPAAAALALLVAGEPIDLELARRAQLPIDALLAHELCGLADDRLHAAVAILPLGPSLLVCDRLDALPTREVLSWPDDSSHHLAGCIPAGRRARWVDLGTGSGFAPLARPELATAITGIDLNPRAVRFATLGAALSRIGHFTAREADLAAAGEPAELVTCNAPLPDPDAAGLPELWRHADPALFDRLWNAIPRAVVAGGLAVVHAARSAIPDALPGERVIVTYAPEFAVLWWRPHAPARLVVAHRELTPDRPHLDARDHDAVC